mgnify:CR=1 FL=1
MPPLRFFFLPEGRLWPDLAPELLLAVLREPEDREPEGREPEGRDPEDREPEDRDPEEDLFPEPERPDSRGI